MSEHAILSASSAEKWLRCPPSARLEANYPDEQSEYAAEGTLAHKIAELKLRKRFITPMGEKSYKAALKKLTSDPLYQQEMDDCTNTYIETIAGIAGQYASPYITAEKTVDYSFYAPKGFGTADCIIIADNTLHVVDYKHGKGIPVSAEDNPQMKLYALGALDYYSTIYHITTVKMTIVQPRLDNISEYGMGLYDLVTWGMEVVRPAAQQAYDGEGEFCPGPWCSSHFCKARHTCGARAQKALAVDPRQAGALPLPAEMTPEQIGLVLTQGQLLASWVKDVEEHALKAILAGDSVPGWKCVEGRKTRQFSDVDSALEKVKGAGYDEALLYERKPITMTAVEKLLGKAKFTELLNENIVVPPGKPTLAPDTDKRPAYLPNGVRSDFEGVETD